METGAGGRYIGAAVTQSRAGPLLFGAGFLGVRADMGLCLGDMPMPQMRPAALDGPAKRYGCAPAAAPDERQIERENQEPEGNHPETENRQKAECSPNDERRTDGNARQTGSRQWNGLVAVAQMGHGNDLVTDHSRNKTWRWVRSFLSTEICAFALGFREQHWYRGRTDADAVQAAPSIPR